MNDWELLELREMVLRDLADLIPPNLYGTLPASDAAIDCKLGKELKFSSSHPKMTMRQRRASNLLWQLGMCNGVAKEIPLIEEEDKRKHYTEGLAGMKGDLFTLAQSYAECLSEGELKFFPALRGNCTDQQGSLKDSERTSLLKMVLGMAVKRYGYDSSKKRNDAVSMIVRDLELVDIQITDDTVRDYLKEAARKITVKPHKS